MRKIIFGIIALTATSCSLEDSYDDMRDGLTSAKEYAIGDTGPGGGVIFYVSTEGFTVEGYTGSTSITMRGFRVSPMAVGATEARPIRTQFVPYGLSKRMWSHPGDRHQRHQIWGTNY